MIELLNTHPIQKTYQPLPVWTGAPLASTYGGKPVLDYRGTPLFAELYALRLFWGKGFEGVWADTYRKTFRTELPEKQEPKIILPDWVQAQLDRINPKGKWGGTWDLILWKQQKLSFVELKRKGKDRIRPTQIDFLERALGSGVPIENFTIFEWAEQAG